MGETDDFTWDDDKDALTFEQRALRLVVAARMSGDVDAIMGHVVRVEGGRIASMKQFADTALAGHLLRP